MGWLNNLFSSSEVLTLKQFIGELKQEKSKLEEEYKKVIIENKGLIEDNHKKDLELYKLTLQIENFKEGKKIIDVKPLTPLQKRIVEHYDKLHVKTFWNLLESLEINKNSLKKYLWDLRKKNYDLKFQE